MERDCDHCDPHLPFVCGIARQAGPQHIQLWVILYQTSCKKAPTDMCVMGSAVGICGSADALSPQCHMFVSVFHVALLCK
jgi:hypothetical protein